MVPLSRRNFLKQTSVASTATLLPARYSKLAWAAPSTHVAGIQLYTVNDAVNKDPSGTLRKIAAIGYKEVEGAGFAKHTASEFRKLVEDAGLKCPSAHLVFGMEETGKLLEDAKALGVSYAVSSVLTARPPDTKDMAGFQKLINNLTLDDFKQIAALANKIGAAAKQAGLQYAYHNHNFEFRDQSGKTGYEILLQETDPELVKFELDCGWMVTAGSHPVDFFERYPGRYRMIHVKDFTSNTKTSTTLGLGPDQAATELGRGHIDYLPILSAAKKAGVEHYFVEQDPPIIGMTSLEAAQVSYDYLHKLL